MKKRINNEEFIKRCLEKHNYKYSYEKTNYKNSNSKVIITCPIHGDFEQLAASHQRGRGCSSCTKSHPQKKKDAEVFILELKAIHNNKYDYSITEYKDCKSKIKIICPIHGIFEQKAGDHLKGNGCKKCGIERRAQGRRCNKEDFVRKSKEIFGELYEYPDNMIYINSSTKVNIICKKHGEFWKTPNNHLSKRQGCPICEESKGELEISRILRDLGVYFEKQKRFKECRNIYTLPFDFYMPDYNICVEFQGEQHFRPVERFGGERAFKFLKERDKIKFDYCNKQNTPKLIYIRNIKNVESVLKEIVNE